MASQSCQKPEAGMILDLFDSWCKTDRLTLQPGTCGAKRASVLRFLEWGQIQRPGDITFEKIQQFVGSLRGRYCARVIGNWKNHISSFCSFLVKLNRLADNPAQGVKLPRVDWQPPIYLEPEDLPLFLQAAEKHGLGLVVQMALYAGLRSDEMRNLRWGNVDLGRRIITVFNREGFVTKTRANRIVPLADPLREALQKELAEKGPRPTDYLFPSPRGAGRRISVKGWQHKLDPIKRIIPGRNITCRIMRHTFASLLAQRGVSVTKIAHWLGNSTDVCTRFYTNPGERFDAKINLFPGQEGGQA